MKKTNNGKATEQGGADDRTDVAIEVCRGRDNGEQKNTVWPPPPTGRTEVPAVDIKRPYLTNSAWLDTVTGVATGIILNWCLNYAVGEYILYYLIPRSMGFFWNVAASCVVTTLASLFVWNWLRRRCLVFASSLFLGGLLLSGILLFLFQPF